MTHLFMRGMFPLHSGSWERWKIDCDALNGSDVDCLAFLLSERLPPFGEVYGIPTGGSRFAVAMKEYATEGPRLIIDDVFTTGSSMEGARQGFSEIEPLSTPEPIGAVVFARGRCPSWITPLFQLWEPVENKGAE